MNTHSSTAHKKRSGTQLLFWFGLLLFVAVSVAAEWLYLEHLKANTVEVTQESMLDAYEAKFDELKTIDLADRTAKHDNVAREAARLYVLMEDMISNKPTSKDEDEIVAYNNLLSKISQAIDDDVAWLKNYYNKKFEEARVDQKSKDAEKIETASKLLQELQRMVENDITSVHNIVSKDKKDVKKGVPIWKDEDERDAYLKKIQDNIDTYNKLLEAVEKEKKAHEEEGVESSDDQSYDYEDGQNSTGGTVPSNHTSTNNSTYRSTSTTTKSSSSQATTPQNTQQPAQNTQPQTGVTDAGGTTNSGDDTTDQGDNTYTPPTPAGDE